MPGQLHKWKEELSSQWGFRLHKRPVEGAELAVWGGDSPSRSAAPEPGLLSLLESLAFVSEMREGMWNEERITSRFLSVPNFAILNHTEEAVLNLLWGKLSEPKTMLCVGQTPYSQHFRVCTFCLSPKRLKEETFPNSYIFLFSLLLLLLHLLCHHHHHLRT